MKTIKALAVSLITTAVLAGCSNTQPVEPVKSDKLIIAHRGASGYLPEHTLESKALAFAQQADYLEQDLAMTKDNRLIVIHDHFLDGLTDVAKKFPKRARKDGRFYVADFTLKEIQTLEMTENFKTENGQQVQVYPNRFPMWKSHFRIHTFEDEIEFIQGLEKSTGKQIGIYPEIKAPWLHHQEGKDIALETLKVLKKYGYDQKSDKVYLQTFDFNELKRIKTELLPKLGMDVKLVQLVAYTDWHETEEKDASGKWVNYNYDWMFKDGAMAEVAKYADGVGPGWYMLVDDKNSKLGDIKYTPMVKDIAKTKMELHPYTVRKDALPEFFSDVNQMYDALLNKAGATGVFTDFPDTGVQFIKGTK
ncbi:glycerophosphodiester phosphodiesterase [Actinobacillus pleuropneumoniae]|uniref:glycerophosphodiester phosphodiesterase n=4 Tax=Actinobacillus pleuropneumoniae TaxID=715 RepID=A3MZ96_ACTP2|nr:glycerophosphodiester phosphodiesterase [Actinobacillus pleuropneumoniae]ABN73482.1 glycerophosphoryl diester phosphodiesterase [Actinobacillus pleuropneumoniae serovar 5b str. L20]ASU16322.1 Glycerophosphodiester phosphodiesterase [Actinobacillus pleuropneumoniae]AWG94796.1 glycerophosphodiester phosphodiesterase [Actinobacillus pleuropneumoniae serovar 1 str. 4074]AXA20869.1 glycerophosphodiester phosphodiesterase [Actinobacillus pleuropneumoniae]EFL78782.1 glycerophosphodiester phosphodi